MSEASLCIQNVNNASANAQFASPVPEGEILLEAFVNLQGFEIAVPSSEFSCLVDKDASELIRFNALFDLKSFIYAQKKFQSKIFDVMEFKIVHQQTENEEEQKQEENQGEQEDEQHQIQHDNPQEEQEKQQLQLQQQQVENAKKRSLQQETAEQESPCAKMPRTYIPKSTAAEHENRHELPPQIRSRSESMNESELNNYNNVDFRIDSDGEEVVNAIADVFNDKEELQEEGEAQRINHQEDDEDGASTVSEASNNSDLDVGKSKDAEVIVKNEKSNEKDDDENGGNDDESATEYKIIKKVLWENGSLGMKVKRQVVDNGGDSSEIPVVTAVEEGSQADKAGIKVGDEFIEVAGKECLSYFTFLLKCQLRPLHLKVKRKITSEDDDGHDDDTSVDSETKADVKTRRLWRIRYNGYVLNEKMQPPETPCEDDVPDESETEIDENGVKKTALKVLPRIRDSSFVENLQKLKEFYKKHGHYTIPTHEKHLQKWLANWKRTGRLYQEKKMVSDNVKEKFDILNALEGFDWGFPVVEKGTPRSKHYDWKKYDWDTCYEMLKEYKEKHGHCYVNKYDKENPALARWVMHVKMQGKTIKKGKSSNILTPERLQKLKEIGLTPEWKRNKETWNDMYNRLKRYKEQYGDCLVPKRWPKDKKLGLWVYDARRAKRMGRKGKMTDERERLLNELGFVWNAK